MEEASGMIDNYAKTAKILENLVLESCSPLRNLFKFNFGIAQ
jgi:hypothetical protein